MQNVPLSSPSSYREIERQKKLVEEADAKKIQECLDKAKQKKIDHIQKQRHHHPGHSGSNTTSTLPSRDISLSSINSHSQYQDDSIRVVETDLSMFDSMRLRAGHRDDDITHHVTPNDVNGNLFQYSELVMTPRSESELSCGLGSSMDARPTNIRQFATPEIRTLKYVAPVSDNNIPTTPPVLDGNSAPTDNFFEQELPADDDGGDGDGSAGVEDVDNGHAEVIKVKGPLSEANVDVKAPKSGKLRHPGVSETGGGVPGVVPPWGRPQSDEKRASAEGFRHARRRSQSTKLPPITSDKINKDDEFLMLERLAGGAVIANRESALHVNTEQAMLMHLNQLDNRLGSRAKKSVEVSGSSAAFNTTASSSSSSTSEIQRSVVYHQPQSKAQTGAQGGAQGGAQPAVRPRPGRRHVSLACYDNFLQTAPAAPERENNDAVSIQLPASAGAVGRGSSPSPNIAYRESVGGRRPEPETLTFGNEYDHGQCSAPSVQSILRPSRSEYSNNAITITKPASRSSVTSAGSVATRESVKANKRVKLPPVALRGSRVLDYGDTSTGTVNMNKPSRIMVMNKALLVDDDGGGNDII